MAWKTFGRPVMRAALTCTLLVTPGMAATTCDQDGVSKRRDGSAIHWCLEQPAAGDGHPILLIAPGSGCAPARENVRLRAISSRLPKFAVLTVEKYGVSLTSKPKDPVTDCSKTYYRKHTVSQHAADARQVLEDLKMSGLWDGPLVLLGGSEGGAMVSVLAHRLAEQVDAIAVISTGTGLTFREILAKIVPSDVGVQVEAKFREIRANPNRRELWGGHSFKWWADIMDRRLSDDLLASKAPILLVHGELDRHAPVASARTTRDAFRSTGDTRLTYWEMEGLHHLMGDTDGVSHLAKVLDDMALWIRTQTN